MPRSLPVDNGLENTERQRSNEELTTAAVTRIALCPSSVQCLPYPGMLPGEASTAASTPICRAQAFNLGSVRAKQQPVTRHGIQLSLQDDFDESACISGDYIDRQCEV